MQEIKMPSTKIEISTFTYEECEAELEKLQKLFFYIHDPDLIIKYKLCKTRLISRLNNLKSVSS